MIAVKFRARYLLAAVAGMGLARVAWAQEPARLSLEKAQAPVTGAHSNQEIADGIAQQLRQNANLRQYNIDISVKGSTVELYGNVGDVKQREQAQKIAMSAPGVTNVVDKLTTGTIQRVSNTQDQPAVLPLTPAPVGSLPAQIPPAQQPMPLGAQPIPQAQIQVNPGVPQTVFGEPRGAADVYGQMGAPNELGTPPLPGYAWPTYAPYNNYSRVAYPEAYPACAWPFIGPFYPFPRVPPGWRSVKLEWQDGHWWFSKTATKYDYWRVRYW
jgi:hypothetical protein